MSSILLLESFWRKAQELLHEASWEINRFRYLPLKKQASPAPKHMRSTQRLQTSDITCSLSGGVLIVNFEEQKREVGDCQ